MKTLFVEAKSSIELKLGKKQIEELPNKVGILTTIQHLHKIKDIQNQLKESVLGGQVLGCDASSAKKIKNQVDGFLYVGSGEFHPLWIAIETGKEVFCFNPFTKSMSKISKDDIEKYNKRKKAALVKFLSSDRIGILVSTKPGQNHMEKALELSKRKDKEYYLFAFDTLNDMELENFPFIQCWVNTACPRIADKRKSIINIDDIPSQ